MKEVHTVSIEEVSNEVAPLSDDQRALVIDFARMLRQRDDIRIPDDFPFEGPELEAWRARLSRHASHVLDQRRRDLEALDVSADGELPPSEWPDDMLAGSKASVAT